MAAKFSMDVFGGPVFVEVSFHKASIDEALFFDEDGEPLSDVELSDEEFRVLEAKAYDLYDPEYDDPAAELVARDAHIEELIDRRRGL